MNGSPYPIVNDALRYHRAAKTAKLSETRERNRKRLMEALNVMTRKAANDYVARLKCEIENE